VVRGFGVEEGRTGGWVLNGAPLLPLGVDLLIISVVLLIIMY
jgi:hypothetical protein